MNAENKAKNKCICRQHCCGIGMTAGPVLIGRMAEVWSLSTGYLVYGGISCGTSLAALVLIPWMNRKAELMSS